MDNASDPHAALVAARQRHAEKLAVRYAAIAELAAAARAKQAVLDRAGAGEPVGPADLVQAETALREAGHVADLAGAVEGACRKALERAEIDGWHADAGAHRAECGATIDLAIEAAAELDRATAAQHAANTKYEAAGIAMAAAHHRAGMFDSGMAARASGNPTLAAKDVGYHPRVNLPLRTPPEKVATGMFFDAAFGEFRRFSWTSLEERLRGIFNRPKALPEAAE